MNFSICCMVTDLDLFMKLSDTLDRNGFGEECQRFLVDNTQQNRMDAFQAVNFFLDAAETEYIIICHDDVYLLDDGRNRLEACIRELTAKDPHWAIAGNAGATIDAVYQRISMPHIQDDGRQHTYPIKVDTVDENFMVVRNDANLAVSRDLEGFHLWAADLCLHARLLGWSSWVINFHLWHGVAERQKVTGIGTRKKGKNYPSLEEQAEKFCNKYAWMSTPRHWNTTCLNMQLG